MALNPSNSSNLEQLVLKGIIKIATTMFVLLTWYSTRPQLLLLRLLLLLLLFLLNTSKKLECIAAAALHSDNWDIDLLCCQTILAAVLPPYLHHLSQQTDDSITKAREEMSVISSLSISVRALVTSCEPLARSSLLLTCLLTVNLPWHWQHLTFRTGQRYCFFFRHREYICFMFFYFYLFCV